MSRTFRRSNADNRGRRWFDDDMPGERNRRPDGTWNGRFSREAEDRELRSKRVKKLDRRQIQLASLED